MTKLQRPYKLEYKVVADILHRSEIYVRANSPEDAANLVDRGEFEEEDVIEYVDTKTVHSVEEI